MLDKETKRWEKLSQRQLPNWFDNSRLGIFVHWGPYSVAGWAEPIGELGTIDESRWYGHNPYSEWLYNTLRIEDSPARDFFEANFPGKGYEDLLDLWDTPTVDFAELNKTFKDAGAGYVVLTTKHHDGVTLWDAPENDGLSTTIRGPRIDLVNEYATAARENNLKFGAYYSGGLDWHRRPFPPLTTHAAVRELRPVDIEYAKIAAEHIRDLVKKYQPDILWNDIDWPDAGKNFEEYGIGKVFEDYYEMVPEGLVNNRWHVPHHDYLTSEYQFGREGETGEAWENCRGIGFSFGYNQNEAKASLDSAGVIRHLIDVACRGGHLLLGVGPKADGTLPDFQMQVLKQMAEWMKIGAGVLPGLRPSTTEYGISLEGEGSFRIGENKTGTYLFVDSAQTRIPLKLRTNDIWKLLTPEFLDIETDGPELSISMRTGRPGAAIFELVADN